MGCLGWGRISGGRGKVGGDCCHTVATIALNGGRIEEILLICIHVYAGGNSADFTEA